MVTSKPCRSLSDSEVPGRAMVMTLAGRGVGEIATSTPLPSDLPSSPFLRRRTYSTTPTVVRGAGRGVPTMLNCGMRTLAQRSW